MKRQFLMFIAIAAFACGTAANAFGQTGKAVRANIEFDFQIGERRFPAGEYSIESISRQSDNILQIRSVTADKQQIIVADLANAGRRQSPKLVFQRFGTTYFLAKIFLDSEQWGYSVRPPRQKREIKRNSVLAETVELRLEK